ncbi:MAG: hypothetical protein R3E82_18660 [Pseudomonadales bacterium]
MSPETGTRWILAVMALLLSYPAAAQQAVVRSYDQPELEVGQAWLVSSGGRCLGVLPYHVATETTVPSLLKEGSGSLRGEAQSVVDLGDDAAFAFMTGAITRDCGLSLGSISRATDRNLRGGGLGALRFINGDGTVGRLAVTVVDDDGQQLLRVQTTDPDERIRKGQSGSLLMVNDQSVGMLLSVNARSGIGTVMRTDALLRKVEDYLRNPISQPQAASQTQATISAPTAELKNQDAWSVAAWNVDPVSSEHTAARLTAEGNEGFWSARMGNPPAALEFSGPGSIRVVNGITFHAGSEVPQAQLPARVQILTSVNADRPAWRVSGSGTLTFEADRATLSFMPVRARYLRIELFDTRGGADEISLSRIRILEAPPPPR